MGWKSRPSSPGDWLNKPGGLALTAFAVSLGAPFCFDLLDRFMNIRSAGKSPDEKPKSPDTAKAGLTLFPLRLRIINSMLSLRARVG